MACPYAAEEIHGICQPSISQGGQHIVCFQPIATDSRDGISIQARLLGVVRHTLKPIHCSAEVDLLEELYPCALSVLSGLMESCLMD